MSSSPPRTLGAASAPCGRLATPDELGLDPAALAADAASARDLARELGIDALSWGTIALVNPSGEPDDVRLRDAGHAGRATPWLPRFPSAARAIAALAEGSPAPRLDWARLALIPPGGLLRCHVDDYRAARVILPLNADGPGFRHAFGELGVCMDAGEAWVVDGDTCHGAANLGQGTRVALLLDYAASAPPARATLPWLVPAERLVARAAWSEAARLETAARARAAGEAEHSDGYRAWEYVWLQVPFRFALTPEVAYDALVDFCRAEGRAERAGYWDRHRCRCVCADEA